MHGCIVIVDGPLTIPFKIKHSPHKLDIKLMKTVGRKHSNLGSFRDQIHLKQWSRSASKPLRLCRIFLSSGTN